MASPVFSSGNAFKSGAVYEQNGTPVDAAALQAQFDQPAAGPEMTGRMSYEGVITKTSAMIVLALVMAVPGYLFPSYPGLIVSAVSGLVLGLVLAFKRTTPPALAMIYAAIEGYFLGSLSIFIETSFAVPGAAVQALIATGATFGVTLWLFRSGRVRYTPKLQKFFIIGGLSYLAFSLVNVGMMIFGATDSAFGMRTGVEIAGIPLGVLVGAVAVILASISLIGDFDFVENGVRKGLPAHFEWRASFALVVTLVWLYTEFLRLIAIVQGRD